MGWISKLLDRVAGVAPTDWTLIDDLKDPGFGVGGKPIVSDACYIELYVESLRLEKARRFATTFNGVIYSFASIARDGANRAQLASVTKPQNLASLDAKHLDRVITVSKRIMGTMPWRGDPLGIELGLFSVKTGNLLSPLVDYISKVSDKAGISVIAKLDPFLPLITQGLDIIAGQTEDALIELAIDTDLSLAESRLCALIAKPKGAIKLTELTIDKTDRKLLHNGEPLNAAYCVFSIRSTDRNPDWGTIPALQEAYAELNRAIVSGKHRDAEEAFAAFNRQVIVCPDLISSDKDRLKDKAKRDLIDAFPGGGQAGKPGSGQINRTLMDLDLYDDARV